MRVVLDWSAERLEAVLVAPGAREPLARLDLDAGLKGAEGRHEAIITEALTPWREAHGALHVLASGMVGARGGWRELGYVAASAGAAEIAAGVLRLDLDCGDRVSLIPGLTDPGAYPYPDVMRGEETQLLGLGLAPERISVTPGNSVKWVRSGQGRIQGFRSFHTGELVALILAHSGLAAPARASGGHRDARAFHGGLELAMAAETPGILASLFSARTGWLAGRLAPEEVGDHLRGLLIGAEFREAGRAGWWHAGGRISIVGDDARVEDYQRAAEALGLEAEVAPLDTVVAGALILADVLEGARDAG